MCEQCDKIEIKIDRYSRMAKMINDKVTLQAVDMNIADLEALKLALHPKQEQ
jgi:hypothetical protein